MQDADPVLLTAAQAAAKTKSSLSQVYRWAQEPGCPVIRLGRRKGIRFLWPDLLAWLQDRAQAQVPVPAGRVPAVDGAVRVAAPAKAGRMSRLERAIREGRVRW